MAELKKESFVIKGKDNVRMESISRPSLSFWQDAWRRLKKNRVAMVALGVIIVLILFAFIGPKFIPYTYSQQIRGAENLFPMKYSEIELASKAAGEKVFPHFFGTDSLGRDLLVRVMYGTRVWQLV